MNAQETIAVADAAINTLTDLDGRGLVTTEWAQAGIDQMREVRANAVRDSLGSLPDGILSAIASDPEQALVDLRTAAKRRAAQ